MSKVQTTAMHCISFHCIQFSFNSRAFFCIAPKQSIVSLVDVSIYMYESIRYVYVYVDAESRIAKLIRFVDWIENLIRNSYRIITDIYYACPTLCHKWTRFHSRHIPNFNDVHFSFFFLLTNNVTAIIYSNLSVVIARFFLIFYGSNESNSKLHHRFFHVKG